MFSIFHPARPRPAPRRGAGLRTLLPCLVTVAAALAPTSPLPAQEPADSAPAVEIAPAEEGTVQEIRLVDGSVLYGRVVEVGDTVRITLVSGADLRIPREQISSVRAARGEVREGRFRQEDPAATRLFFGPTARTLPAGRGSIGVFEVLLPFVDFGITDALLLTAGTPLLFEWDDLGGRPIYFGPKLRILHRERLGVAVGSLLITTLDLDGFAGFLYGTATVGSRDRALTGGVGFGFADDDVADRPVLLLGGETRVSERIKLLSENWVLPSEGGLLSGGIRFLGERLSADLGLALPVGTGDDVLLPVVNFVWTW